MPTRPEIQEMLENQDMTLLLLDGFDEAFIGWTQRINEEAVACYSYDKMVDLLVKRDSMNAEEAMEYIDFNCVGAWVGERTPFIVYSVA